MASFWKRRRVLATAIMMLASMTYLSPTSNPLLSILYNNNNNNNSRFTMRRLALSAAAAATMPFHTAQSNEYYYATPETVLNLPSAKSHGTVLPSHLALCREWLHQETHPSETSVYGQAESRQVCLDWTAPHYDLMEMISSTLIASAMPVHLQYRSCMSTDSNDDKKKQDVGCDPTTVQQALEQVGGIGLVNVNEDWQEALRKQCKSVLVNYDAATTKQQVKVYALRHPFAWPIREYDPDHTAMNNNDDKQQDNRHSMNSVTTMLGNNKKTTSIDNVGDYTPAHRGLDTMIKIEDVLDADGDFLFDLVQEDEQEDDNNNNNSIDVEANHATMDGIHRNAQSSWTHTNGPTSTANDGGSSNSNAGGNPKAPVLHFFSDVTDKEEASSPADNGVSLERGNYQRHGRRHRRLRVTNNQQQQAWFPLNSNNSKDNNNNSDIGQPQQRQEKEQQEPLHNTAGPFVVNAVSENRPKRHLTPVSLERTLPEDIDDSPPCRSVDFPHRGTRALLGVKKNSKAGYTE